MNLQQQLEQIRDDLGADAVTIVVHDTFSVIHVHNLGVGCDSIFYGDNNPVKTLDEAMAELQQKVAK